MIYTITADGNLIYNSASQMAEYSVLEPKCKRERGKAGVVSFSMLPEHPFYGRLERLKTEIVCMEDTKEIFRGRVYEIETDIDRKRSVTCEGNLSYLVDSLQPPDRSRNKKVEPVSYDSSWSSSEYAEIPINHSGSYSKDYSNIEEDGREETVLDHFTRLITEHNSQVETWKQFAIGNITISEKSETVTFDASNYRDTMNAIESDIINYYGGYLQTRRVGNVTYLDYIKEETATLNQTINFGQNILDLTCTLPADDIFTCLVPVGDDECTISSVNDGKVYLQNNEAVAKYGHIFKTQSFSGITDASKLKSLGEKYMAKNCKIDPVKFTVTALDLKNLGYSVDAFDIGVKVHVIAPRHGIDKTIECLSIEIKMDAPEETAIELGEPEETLSERYKKDSRSSDNAASDARASGRAGGASSQELFKYLKENGKTLLSEHDKIIINAEKIDALNTKLKVFIVEANYAKFDRGLHSMGGLNVEKNAIIKGHLTAQDGLTIGSNVVGIRRDKLVTGASVHVSLGTSHGRLGYLTGVWVDSAWVELHTKDFEYYTIAGERPT